MVEIREFASADGAQVIELWEACGLVVPWNDPRKDIARKVADSAGEFLVAAEAGAVIGTAMAGYDGHRGWIYYLAVDTARRGEGIGRRLVGECERKLAARGCAKVNLMVRSSNEATVAFYDRLGYAASDVITLGRRLESDAPVPGSSA